MYPDEMLNLCRLCQSRPGTYKLLNGNLSEQIFTCTSIKIDDNLFELLPPAICDQCKKIIAEFFDYLQKVRKTDSELRNLIKSDRKPDEESTKKNKFKCTVCSKRYARFANFTSHQQTHAETFKNASIDDDVVDEKIDKTRLKSKRSAKTAVFVCKWDDCNKPCTSAYTLKTHEMKHEGKRPFLCVTCGKGFVTKNSLTCHEKIHLEVKAYACDLCNIGFSVRSNLRAHEKKYHEGVRFYCSQCTRAYISKASLERHERLHTGIKEFQCESCPSAFYTSKELVKHRRYHQGIRSHKCGQCFKTFFEKHHLTIHLRIHTGERPYVCKIAGCGKSFTESQKLTRHLKATHINVK